MIWYALNSSLAFVDAMILILFIFLFLEKGKWKWLDTIAIVVVTITGILSNEMTKMNAVITIIVLMELILYAWWISEKHLGKAIIAAGIIYFLLGGIAMLSIYFTSAISGMEFTEAKMIGAASYMLIRCVCCKSLTIIIGLLILKIFRREAIRYLSKMEWGIMMVNFLVEFLILAVMFYTVFSIPAEMGKYNVIYGILAISILGLYMGFLYIFFLMNRTNREKEQYRELVLVQKTSQKIIEEKELQYNALRILRHDLRHYFRTSLDLLNEQKYDSAKEYMQKVINTKIENMICFAETGNEMIDASVNACFVQCEKENIKVDVQLSGEWVFDNEIDIGIILCNLLENAIHGCEGCPNPKIIVKSRNIRNYLRIDIDNTYCEEKQLAHDRTAPEKGIGQEHGLGLKSVRMALEANEGSFTQRKENGWYKTTVLIKRRMAN